MCVAEHLRAGGKGPAAIVLETDSPVGRLRGRVHRLGDAGVPVIVTYHPAYLLRRPQAKADAWRDLVAAAAVVRESPEAG